jgi:predicted nucleotidyltransferase
MGDKHQELAQKLADLFQSFPNVEAIGLAGSLTAQSADLDSDVDLYVYTTSVIPLEQRRRLVERAGARQAELNLQFWDLGDEWIDAATGIEVDVIYWDHHWISEQLDRVLVRHEANVGYTTSFWHTLRNSQILFDRSGWLTRLKEQAQQPYPDELRRAIIAKNHPILRRVIPSYLHQIEKALKRKDLVSINHRVAALLASYFEVVFAINRLPNPGEKRLLAKAANTCIKLPPGMAGQVEKVLLAAGSTDPGILASIEALVDGLDRLLDEEGFDPEKI